MKRQQIIIAVVVVVVVCLLVSVFSGIFGSGDKPKEQEPEKKTVKAPEKEPEKEPEEEKEADIEEVEYENTEPTCERTKIITAQSGSLGSCRSPDDIDPKSVTFTGAAFRPKNPVRSANWIHELSSTDDRKEYIASHQSSDNWCKMVRFEIVKTGDICNYKVLDAGYTPSSSKQGESTCTTKTKVLENWASKNDSAIAKNNQESGYGIEKLKYDKFC